MVKVDIAWPSRSVTTLTATPAAMSSVAWVWRRSCVRPVSRSIAKTQVEEMQADD
jgi:hypothetical protein